MVDADDLLTRARRFWIGVASMDHVNVGVKGAFIQLNHGKKAPLRRLKAGDGVIMYSPRTAYPDGEPLQAFTAIGTVATGDVYQVEVTSHFKPHRVDVQFVPSKEAQIKPLVGRLSFIKSQSHWGAAFRFGSVEIPGSDFALIAERMGAAPLAEYARSMGGGVGCQSAGPSQPRCTSKLACDKLSVLMAPRSRPVISTVKSNECSTEIMAESIHRRP